MWDRLRPHSWVVINLESGARPTWVKVPILSLTSCVALGKWLYSLNLCTQPLEVENKRAFQVCTRELAGRIKRENSYKALAGSVCSAEGNIALKVVRWHPGECGSLTDHRLVLHTHWVKLPGVPRRRNTSKRREAERRARKEGSEGGREHSTNQLMWRWLWTFPPKWYNEASAFEFSTMKRSYKSLQDIFPLATPEILRKTTRMLVVLETQNSNEGTTAGQSLSSTRTIHSVGWRKRQLRDRLCPWMSLMPAGLGSLKNTLHTHTHSHTQAQMPFWFQKWFQHNHLIT